ncbi:MAG: DUF4038 domain-containing protein [Chryseolinea sp.]
MKLQCYSLLLFTIMGNPVLAQVKPSLSVSKNGHYIVDRINQPVFWQGDTEWELFHLFHAKEAQALLLERKKQGFNFVQIMATGVFPEWGQSKGVEFKSKEEAWANANPNTPNLKYFARVDSIISLAEKNNMTLVVGIFHAADLDKKRITLSNIKGWATWIAKRYKAAPNIIWSMYPHADSASVPIIKLAVEGLQAGDGGAHFITIHPDPSPKSSSFMHTSPWLAFNTLQTWSNEYINYEMVFADYQKTPAKPVINGEARYESEDGTTPLQTRMAGYWSCLAGGFYSYGHESNWKSPLTWKTWFNSDGAKQMKIMGDFFRSINWTKMVPEQSVLVNPAKGDVASISTDKDFAIVYITNQKPFSVQLNKLKSKEITGWWIDPVTGNKTKSGDYSVDKVYAFGLPQGWKDGLMLFKPKE